VPDKPGSLWGPVGTHRLCAPSAGSDSQAADGQQAHRCGGGFGDSFGRWRRVGVSGAQDGQAQRGRSRPRRW
jgi:hypothetical protein